MGTQTLLVVCDEGQIPAVDRDIRAKTGASVRALADVENLIERLCYDTVDCLLVGPSIDGTPGEYVARGVRGLFPDLPVVVAGIDDETADEIDVTAAGTDDVTDRAVVDAVEDRLNGDTESAAARPPSRMETLLLSLFEGVPDHMYAKDEDARFVFTNSGMAPFGDAIGARDLMLYEEPYRAYTAKTVADDRRVIDEGESVIDVDEFTIDEESRNHVLTTKVPWRDADGEITGLVGITRDITTRKHRDRALRQRNERLAKAALVAAHELRNELQVATGRLELLDDDPRQRDVVAESLDRLEAVVDDVVSLTARERHVADEQPVWISTSAGEVWEDLEADPERLELAQDVRILADPQALRLLFDILLSNALEHGGRGVTVTVGRSPDGFYVADDGTGIEADPPERVFDAGFASTDGKAGFGLYVAQRIANDHGWTLEATNQPGGGARFDVRGVETTG